MVDRTKRPPAPLEFGDLREWIRKTAQRANAAFNFDGSNSMTRPLLLASYAITDLPDAALWTRGVVYVTDDVGGAVPAFSDGTDWRRFTDRAVVSTT